MPTKSSPSEPASAIEQAQPEAPERPLDATEIAQLATINDAQNAKGQPVYTASKGETVLWYEAGIVSPETGVPAVVTAIERPGLLTLAIFRPQSTLLHKSGVRYEATIRDVERKTQLIFERGSWDFLEFVKPERRHKDPWQEYCQAQIDQCTEALAKYRKERAEHEARMNSSFSP